MVKTKIKMSQKIDKLLKNPDFETLICNIVLVSLAVQGVTSTDTYTQSYTRVDPQPLNSQKIAAPLEF